MLPKADVPNTPIHNAPPPLVEVSGTHGEMGRQIGEARRAQIQHSIANAHILIEQSFDQLELTWEGAQFRPASTCPLSRSATPNTSTRCRALQTVPTWPSTT